MKWHKASLIIIGCVALCGLGIRQAFVELTRVERGQHVEHVDWLPKTASNVSYSRTYNWQYYEFDISESDFRHWAARHWVANWKVSEIRAPFYVTRNSVLDEKGFREYYNGPQEFIEKTGTEISQPLPDYIARIENGLCYYSYNEKTHGGIYVGFDREKHRTFVHYAAR